MLSIKAKNLKEWERLAVRTGKAFNAPDVIREVETVLNRRWQRISKEMFDSEGSFGKGGRWASLSADYAEQKARQYPGKTILRRKDRLYRSFVTRRENVGFGARSGQGFIYKYGSTVPYADFHQQGTPLMPARKVINPSRQQLTGISAAIGRTIVDGVFRRRWFDKFTRRGLKLGFVNRGFDVVDIP